MRDMYDFSKEIIDANSGMSDWHLKEITSTKIIEETEEYTEYRVVYQEVCQGISGKDFEDIKVFKG